MKNRERGNGKIGNGFGGENATGSAYAWIQGRKTRTLKLVVRVTQPFLRFNLF
jgi:hypothetical protein